MIKVVAPKDPNDDDDFAIDWANVLIGAETISGVLCAVALGDVTLGTPAISGTVTTVRISAGTDGTSVAVRYRITTSTGRQIDRTLLIPVATQ